MYSQAIVTKRLSRLAENIRGAIDPRFDWKEYSTAEVQERVSKLADVFNPLDGSTHRPLSVDENDFIRHEINRCKVDFLYWCERYAFIKDKAMSLVRLTPTSVQRLLIARMAKAEEDAVLGKSGDGILFNVLKARQLGCSTISDIIIAHRVFFYANTTALIAADIPQRTQNLYEMVNRVFINLPWWMKPRSSDDKKDYKVKNTQISFADQDSIVRFGSSSNMAGGDSGADKGSLGTGMTLPLVHLSELALWENPYQIDDALMPSIPMNPRTFAIFESTAKGRNNWWHDCWMDSKKGLGRRKPVFIPWYTDPDTYKLPAPADWVPNASSEAHSNRVFETSAQWVGHSVRLTRDQLYWYERTRAEYQSKRILHKFLAEYTADDLESFQHSTTNVFGHDLIGDLRNKASNVPILVEIRPKMKMEKLANNGS